MLLTDPDFLEVSSAGSALFAQVEALYLAAFPASERKPTRFLAEVLARPDYRMFALASGDALQGFAIVHASAADMALLEFLAVDDRMRGLGLGSLLFQRVVEAVAGTLVLEVESDAGAESPRSPRVRRKLFYRQLGCREVAGLAYRMPRVSAEDPPPMHLMLHGFADAAVTKARLRTWLEAIYRDVYDRPPDDPAIAAMLAGLPDRIEVS